MVDRLRTPTQNAAIALRPLDVNISVIDGNPEINFFHKKSSNDGGASGKRAHKSAVRVATSDNDDEEEDESVDRNANVAQTV